MLQPISRIVNCCGVVLFLPPVAVIEDTPWPKISTDTIKIDTLSKLFALFNQKDSILASAAETYSLSVACSISEVQALLTTFCELGGAHFGIALIPLVLWVFSRTLAAAFSVSLILCWKCRA